MTTIRVPGTVDPYSDSSELEGERLGGLIKVQQTQAVRVDVARAAAGEAVTVEDVAEDDLIELELDGGVKLWTTLQQYRDDFGTPAPRGERTGAVEFPTVLPVGTPSRGLGTWALKALRILKVDLSEMAACKVAEKLEERIKPGLYRCRDADGLILEAVPAGADVKTDRPILVFLHGTASSTEGCFGELWEPEQHRIPAGLRRAYGDGIYTFEHRTLSESPLVNSVQLVEALPHGATLHLVSHSRGGLIGELLCRGSATGGESFGPREVELFRDEGGVERARDREALRKLGVVLKAKKLRVQRFVRVACPARGTTLASKRLDRWLSIIVNLVGMVPGFKKNPLYELLTDFLLAVVKERTDPSTLPGLEAMMPSSPLIRLVNPPGLQVEADLTVLAGDIEASGIIGRLKLLIPDLYYQCEHDLVVDTRAMFGGAARVKGGRSFFDQGPEVNHFRYFRNRKTAEMLLAGLSSDKVAESGFVPLALKRPELTQRAYRQAAVPQPVLFVLPGITGSHLAVKRERVWIDAADLAIGGMSRLEIGNPDVTPEALVAMAYGDIIEYLSGSHEVIPFPYDWRGTLTQEARRLGRAVAEKLDQAERDRQPVRLLAHSTGGLLARAMIALRPDLWERITRQPGARLIMLGTPNGGAYAIPRMLLGQDRLVRLLALIDIEHDQEGLLRIIAQYPGLLELLPAEGSFDFFSPALWQRLKDTDDRGWIAPDPKRLEAARDLQDLLAASPIDRAHMLYVAGRARATPFFMELQPDAREGARIRFLATPYGDGRVPWSTGIPIGLKTWYMDAEHGDLANHEPAFQALLDLLQSGDTSRLPTVAPVPERGLPERFELPPDIADIFPDQAELEAAAMGAHPHLHPTEKGPRVKVSVAHGNLSFARYPVAVGHYEGDTIVSAESLLDLLLEGRLRTRHRLGLYPGPLETAAIFVNPKPHGRPAAAVVVGLGPVGKLTPAGLARTFARGTLDYALAVAENRCPGAGTPDSGPRSATLSTLLIGTGAGGLPVKESVTAVLRGVVRANLALQESGQDKHVVIDGIQFLEIWEDRAIEAAHALQDLAGDADLRGSFDCQTLIRRVSGARSRVVFEEDPGWWQRLQITAEEDGGLRFNAMTDMARVESLLQPTQRALVDRFLQRAIRCTRTDQSVARILFEILVPTRLKEQTPERHDLILVLNDEAARYPWELLEDRASSGRNPLAVDTGLLRQLETTVFREQVRTAVQDTALVVGDPKSAFVPLPAAEEEANVVWQLLEHRGFHAEKHIRQTADVIVEALHADEYRILHLAGHGVHEHPLPLPAGKKGHKVKDQERRTVSGMVIGDDMFLSPQDVEKMRVVPELVFVNCCHLGRIEGADDTLPDDRHLLAANLASQFIRMGVRAVVAAGWAVDDRAANTFTTKFYEALLDGAPFGRAVQAARKATFDEHRGVNTWGAYQCYGDPDYVLRKRAEHKTDGRHGRAYVSPAEAIVELENLASQALGAASDECLASGLERLRELAQGLLGTWPANAAMRAALGRAFGEFDQFAEAIEHYTAALEAEPAEFPVGAIEELANLQGRYAVDLWQRCLGGREDDAEQQVDQAIARLETLCTLGRTVERLSLLGRVHKRRAWVTTGGRRREALEQMCQYYKEAHELARDRTGELNAYPLLNWLTAETILRWRKPAKGERLERERHALLQQVEGRAEERERDDPGLCTTLTRIDSALLRHLDAEDLDEHADAIVAAYWDARRRAASPREFRSVCEQLAFLMEMVSTEGGSAARKRKLGEPLRRIRDQLSCASTG